mmetsp:Transcript_13850/g.32296  ORF Transcript_13850/g.32296 Transcript_13850/m.32296 type:complete len:279 (+) Transcript_13850:814-1650(+)
MKEIIVIHEKRSEIRKRRKRIKIIISHVHHIIREIQRLHLVGKNGNVDWNLSRQAVSLEVEGNDNVFIVTFNTHPVTTVSVRQPIVREFPGFGIFYMHRRDHVGAVEQGRKNISLEFFSMFQSIYILVLGHPKHRLPLRGYFIQKVFVQIVTVVCTSKSVLESSQNILINALAVHLFGDNTRSEIVVCGVHFFPKVRVLIFIVTSGTRQDPNQDNENNTENGERPLVVTNKRNDCRTAISSGSARFLYRITSWCHVRFRIRITCISWWVVSRVVFDIF